VAYTSREVDASAEETFAVLLTPETYPEWLVGASSIQDVDDTWPAPGSRFAHRVGLGPFVIPDYTELLDVEENCLLKLRVRARPFIYGLATFRVIGSDGHCVVTLEEEPELRTLGNLVRPVMDPLVHLRNHRSLQRLAQVVERRARSGRGDGS
jgi:hypothetical protein